MLLTSEQFTRYCLTKGYNRTEFGVLCVRANCFECIRPFLDGVAGAVWTAGGKANRKPDWMVYGKKGTHYRAVTRYSIRD